MFRCYSAQTKKLLSVKGSVTNGAVYILYNALGVGERVEILLYCVIIGKGVLELV